MTMQPGAAPADQAAQDDAHLRSLGIKPELQRTLGFLSNFAVAFSYISVSTGTFTNRPSGSASAGRYVLLGLAPRRHRPDVRGPQLRRAVEPLPGRGVDLPVVEAASNRTLGWFTGWIYFWAGVVTVTAVAVTVPLVLSTIIDIELATRRSFRAWTTSSSWAS